MYFYLYIESTLVTMCFTTNKVIKTFVNKIESQQNSEKSRIIWNLAFKISGSNTEGKIHF